MLLAHAIHEKARNVSTFDANGRYLGFGCGPQSPQVAAREAARLRVVELLQTTKLRGWHCTRLTDEEAAQIRRYGMQLPDPEFLKRRIKALLSEMAISRRVASRLAEDNQGGQEFRRGRIWFCFFPPRTAGHSGIGELLGLWGGEALYSCHRSDEAIGRILRTIGRPRLVEADIPIAALNMAYFFGDRIINRYLAYMGFPDFGDTDHEDWLAQKDGEISLASS